jgi:beta-phosphoglucomutase-like phosphatase (HAD superfamily)
MVGAVIFDLNGTVLADEYIYGRAFGKVLAFLGRRIDKAYPQIAGIGVEENWPGLISKYHIKTSRSYNELARMTQDAYLSNISKVKIKAGFKDFIFMLRRHNIKTALATSNTWWMVDKVFEKLNLSDYFDTVTTKEEVNFNKPSPDIFLLTAEKLGVKNDNCVVIEDSEAGIEAAKAAGMKAIALMKDDGDKKHIIKPVDLIVANFKDISLTKLNLI